MSTSQASVAREVVRRVYAEKRSGFDVESRALRDEIRHFPSSNAPELSRLEGVRILHRYDVTGLDEAEFQTACTRVFAEVQCDDWHTGAMVPGLAGGDREIVIATEYLPGQYDQRADSAAQCVALLFGTRPVVRCARVYVFTLASAAGPHARDALLSQLVNPVDSREASLALPQSLEIETGIAPAVPVLAGFRALEGAALSKMASDFGLAMSIDDLAVCRAHFEAEGRDPSLAELRVLDTYWSDHCRHTTFMTSLSGIDVEDGSEADDLRHCLALWEAAREEVYGDAAYERPHTLMDLATIGGKLLRKRGQLADLEVSEEINACSVHVTAKFTDGSEEPWLLMFKNETHNHPTEIEPFGGAATCLGGAIRDPLSGRSYVHQAMRVTGGGDPRQNPADTLQGKLPQLKIAREAAHGYSSYGNQIGLATGQVAEFYHDGFVAKRMELGAVIAAVPASWVRREEPAPGDIVILLGGRTGRDGIGGATGSSREHTEESVKTAGAEVQKGNPVEERKIQRLFRSKEVCSLIKRCNDFGAGGVCVAVGELARGLSIDLDRVPRKYEGLDGVELATSESQERMAVVVAPEDVECFIALANGENLEAVTVATVTADERLVMTWRGETIVDLDRRFLDTNGATRSAAARIEAPSTCTCCGGECGGPGEATPASPAATASPAAAANPAAALEALKAELGSLRTASRRGLQEIFDGSIGSSSVLFPFGGATQGTPECGMAALLPALDRDAASASLMSFGYNPEIAQKSPFKGARVAVLESLARYVSLGGKLSTARLSLQEYFERTSSPEAWGKPLAALLAALEAQIELGTAAIGGKDSMSGTYRDPGNDRILNVPPTLVSFAAGITDAARVSSAALSTAGDSPIVLFALPESGSPWETFRANCAALEALRDAGMVRAACAVQAGGPLATLALMAFGNRTSLEVDLARLDRPCAPGSFIVELTPAAIASCLEHLDPALAGCTNWNIIARTIKTDSPAPQQAISAAVFRLVNSAPALEAANTGATGSAAAAAVVPLDELRRLWEAPLSRVYPQTASGKSVAESSWPEAGAQAGKDPLALSLSAWRDGHGLPAIGKRAKPLVVLPVFPGTNCEWDMERAFRRAGAETKQVLFRNRSPEEVRESSALLARAISGAQILALSGGFSAGDEPEGSGKFIANALRAPAVAHAVNELVGGRDGLILGICNGFQALIKLGLVPYGEIRECGSDDPTLTFNELGRHVSRMVTTRVMSNKSPWLALDPVDSLQTLPVSHGEGRLAVNAALGEDLLAKGQVAFCYADETGSPTMREPWNPNGSAFAIEGLLSPDGRVLGKMGHSERVGPNVHKNIPASDAQRIFEAGVRWFL